MVKNVRNDPASRKESGTSPKGNLFVPSTQAHFLENIIKVHSELFEIFCRHIDHFKK